MNDNAVLELRSTLRSLTDCLLLLSLISQLYRVVESWFKNFLELWWRDAMSIACPSIRCVRTDECAAWWTSCVTGYNYSYISGL